MLSLFALPSAWSPQVDGRAVASRRTALSLGAALFAPLPAFATSKEKAKQMAIQKETAKEAKEAMKQYKFAPRPELEYGKKPDGTMGYVFVEGTVKPGSQGELSSCEHRRHTHHHTLRRTPPHTPLHTPQHTPPHASLHTPLLPYASRLTRRAADATQFSTRRAPA